MVDVDDEDSDDDEEETKDDGDDDDDAQFYHINEELHKMISDDRAANPKNIKLLVRPA